MRQEQRAESLSSISSNLRLMHSKEFRHPKLQPIKSVTPHRQLLMGKSNLRWLYSRGNKATGNWLMKPLGSEVAWDQREGKGSRGDKKQGETSPNLLLFFSPLPIVLLAFYPHCRTWSQASSKEPHFFLLMELLMLVNCKQSSY